MNQIKKVWIVDDDNDLCQYLMNIFKQTKDFEVIGTSNTLKNAYNHVTEENPDLITVDLSLPDGFGIDLIKWLNLHFPSITKTIVSFWGHEKLVFEAFLHGANGYIQKDKLLMMKPEQAIATLKVGSTEINPKLAKRFLNYFQALASKDTQQNLAQYQPNEKESKILALLIKGLNYDEVAEGIQASRDDIIRHMTHIYHKLYYSAQLVQSL